MSSTPVSDVSARSFSGSRCPAVRLLRRRVSWTAVTGRSPPQTGTWRRFRAPASLVLSVSHDHLCRSPAQFSDSLCVFACAGEFPVMTPGKVHEYASCTTFSTPSEYMEGHYTFHRLGELTQFYLNPGDVFQRGNQAQDFFDKRFFLLQPIRRKFSTWPFLVSTWCARRSESPPFRA